MPRHRSSLIAPIFLAYSFALAATPAQAAPESVAPHNATILPDCTGPSRSAPSRVQPVCVVRAVGDFDGDGVDDLLLEQVPVNGPVGTGSARTFSLHLGPFGGQALPDSDQARPARTRFQIRGNPVGGPITVADVDEDGLDDLIFTAAERVGQVEYQRVAIFPGRQTDWPADHNLEAATAAPITFERSRRIVGSRHAEGPDVLVTTAVGDLNADGRPDVVLGIDPTAAQESRGVAVAPRGGSEIAVMFGSEGWPARSTFRDDLVIRGIGRCTQSLAGVADVTGDGIDDIVLRACAEDGLPDQPLAVAGARDLPATIDMLIPPPEPDPTEPVRPSGYVALAAQSNSVFTEGRPFFIADLNQDGVADLGLGLGDNTHVWLGGPDMPAKLAARRTDRVLVGARFGMTNFTRTWQPRDLDGDREPDLALIPRGPILNQSARTDQRGTVVVSTSFITERLRIFGAASLGAPVVDTDLDTPILDWRVSRGGDELWAMGDFNGDGQTDLLLGNPIQSAMRHLSRARSGSVQGSATDYALVFGPIPMQTEPETGKEPRIPDPAQP